MELEIKYILIGALMNTKM